ncbi:hypothetical protein CHUAL_012550 [Chamberlinius hualienensis]
MVAVVTNGASSAYGQIPVIELPPAEVAVIEEDPGIVDEAIVEEPVTRMFFRSNGVSYGTSSEPATNGYGVTASSNGARRFRLLRTNAARRQRNFLRNNGFGRSGSYGASASATSANGYSTPAPAPSQFLPVDLAEGVSIPQIPGVAGVDYPIYSQALISAFNCNEKMAPGYYADTETKCQVFHLCQPYSDKTSFLCPNGTMFNEKYSVCDWWFNVKCRVNGYSSYRPYTPIYSSSTPPPTPAPVQQIYQVQEEVPAVIEQLDEVPVMDVAVDPAVSSGTDEEALRMLRFRSNRLRSRGRSQLRTKILRTNAVNYQQQSTATAPGAAVTDASASGYLNGGGRSRIVLRTNRMRFRAMRNEAHGEVHYGAQNGNGALESTPIPQDPSMTEAVPTAVPDVEGGEVTTESTDSGEEEAAVTEEVMINGLETTTNSSEEPVIVLLNGDPQVNGEGAATTNGSNGSEPSSTNGASSINGNGVVSVVHEDIYGGARFGRRLRPLLRSFVRPRKARRSSFIQMTTPELAGTRYDPSTSANFYNGGHFRA